jgi:hypothetical protein
MPCQECGRSAKRHGGACVGLSYDEDGTAHYYCLSCAIGALAGGDVTDNTQ